MPRYFVTMKIAEADQGGPALRLDGLTAVLREAILPTLESLVDLQERGKDVLGGYLSGQQSVVVILEADSEEEVYEILEGLPAWDKTNTEVARLRLLEELSAG